MKKLKTHRTHPCSKLGITQLAFVSPTYPVRHQALRTILSSVISPPNDEEGKASFEFALQAFIALAAAPVARPFSMDNVLRDTSRRQSHYLAMGGDVATLLAMTIKYARAHVQSGWAEQVRLPHFNEIAVAIHSHAFISKMRRVFPNYSIHLS